MKEALFVPEGGVGRVAEEAAEGALAGLLATAAMSLFTAALMAGLQRAGVSERQRRRLERSSPEGLPPTEKAAAELEAAAGRRPSRREREAAGEAIHWTFGVVLGVVYGLLSSRTRRARAGRGLAYGAAVFAGASEAALPALGLALPPSSYAPAGHALNLVSHLVYGATLDAATRSLRTAVVGARA